MLFIYYKIWIFLLILLYYLFIIIIIYFYHKIFENNQSKQVSIQNNQVLSWDCVVFIFGSSCLLLSSQFLLFNMMKFTKNKDESKKTMQNNQRIQEYNEERYHLHHFKFYHETKELNTER